MPPWGQVVVLLLGSVLNDEGLAHDHHQRLKAGKCDVISERLARSMNWIGPCRNGLAHGIGVMVMDKTQVHRQRYERGKLVSTVKEVAGTTGDGTYFYLSCDLPCQGAKTRAISADELPDWARPHLLRK